MDSVLSIGLYVNLIYFILFTNHQPDHILDDAESAWRKLGKDRAEKESYLFKSLLDGNALVAMGSDWPVSCGVS